MKTTRISSGFDIELQLGANWFRTALDLLNENGLLGPPGLPIIISDVQITFEPGWDLKIDVIGLGTPVMAKAVLNTDGKAITLTTNFPQLGERTIPFDVLKGLSGIPLLIKRHGDTEHDPAMVLLANLAIHAEPQNEEPRDLNSDPLLRGNPDNAFSFLPLGQDVAFGISSETLQRFGNNIWHTQLRAIDGTHPLPDSKNKKGEWSIVTVTGGDGKIKIKLEGDIPVDSPIIDIIPDPHVTITLTLTPSIMNGVLTFSIEPDTDVDTGLLGNLFGAISGVIGGGVLGGIIGFIVGLVTGGILAGVLAGLVVGAGIGLVAGIIVIEIAEVIVEGIVQKEIKAMLNGVPLADLLCDENGIVQVAKPDQKDGFNLSVLDAVPSSIPVNTANPKDEFLYKKSLLVTSVYDEFTVDANGFAVAGKSGTDTKYQPEIVSVKSFNYHGDELKTIDYIRKDGKEQTLDIAEVYERTSNGELISPLSLLPKPEKSTLRIPEGKLPCVTLKPIAIRREKTIVKEIEFENNLRLMVSDAVKLQDNAAILVTGYQLIHPKGYNAYFRGKADPFLDNNFESLPKFKRDKVEV